MFRFKPSRITLVGWVELFLTLTPTPTFGRPLLTLVVRKANPAKNRTSYIISEKNIDPCYNSCVFFVGILRAVVSFIYVDASNRWSSAACIISIVERR